jgi:peptidoglycan/xylan/chitin deacetylase (PgdA/CDA1 family)
MKSRWLIALTLAIVLGQGCAQSKMKNMQRPGTNTIQENIQPLSLTPDLEDGAEYLVRQPHPLSLADLHSKYHSTFFLNGDPSKREVALTFDDAPDANFSPQVLDVLKGVGVKATFFVVGNRAEAHPDIMKRIVAEGHAIGNHSYSHANLPKLTDAEFRSQIEKTDTIIRRFTGYTSDIVRPPYGNINEPQIQWLGSQQKKIISWNVDSLDWKGLNAEQVITNVLGHVHPGSIILQHAAGGTNEDLSGTVKALPKIINQLQADGVKLVTVPELFNIPIGR